LVLAGSSQTLHSSVPVSVGGLQLTTGGVKTLEGEWTVLTDLLFDNGANAIVRPSIAAISAGKLLYTGSEALTSDGGSYIDGVLYQKGGGFRFYPIGRNNTYAPMSITSGSDAIETGAQVFLTGIDPDPSVTFPLGDINSIATDRYWQLTTIDGAFGGSIVSLDATGSILAASSPLAVIEANAATNATTFANLGGLEDDGVITSTRSATQAFLTIGISERVDLQINDLITPFNSDGVNDFLTIRNIEYTYQNKVTLIDRWGVVVNKWTNFKNYDDPGNTDNFDFSTLSPGNYVCILQYQLTEGASQQELTQMITVLKGNP
jgi:hypothetical protein